MGLPSGWITDPIHQLTANQQIAALGNGVLPLQALSAMRVGALVQADAAS
jgi:DNA (cytosine-5)-methyltransferase 1